MKRVKISVLLFVGLVMALTNLKCNKYLEEQPVSSITPETFWRDQNDAKAWMAGIYNQLQSTLNTNWFDWGEVRSDNVKTAGTGNAQTKLLNNILSANDADINGVTRWTALYTTISLCNYGIKYFPGMIDKNLDQGVVRYKDNLGQCYGLRALMYFYGLRVWGRVPIITEPIESLTQETEFARSDIDAVKKQILDDIAKALETIGSNTSGPSRYYMQKAAVYALQTDVYMWFQDYDNALIAAEKAILESKCTWVTTPLQWKNIFLNPETSTETIFNIYWDDTERGGGVGICQKLGSGSNTNQYMITPKIFQELRDRTDVNGIPIDGRFWTCFDTIKFFSATVYSLAVAEFGKYYPWASGQAGPFVFESNAMCKAKIPVYRFADVQLLKAEALTHKGRYQEALNILNQIRSRCGYPVQAQLADFTGDVMKGIERAILKERQYEFLGEGKRWFDLCRIDKMYDFSNNGYAYLRETMNPILSARVGATPFDNTASVPNGMGRILYPINSDAFNANSKLRGDQNPPYDE
ncbi:RagB/SusD family nutrient uptake outer membrane protein [Chitinophaga niabensis]|uniref:Starch-binding associating with outer membrane n=1 Tax=Chitinophaga niabensis TaxID=536979 RepID=A0A1N6K544_9BACT|nr:RagB/SusD family nutrient uptake outer membrane protein [Chitinophaga niabensis]SIO51651.1 Starch-binding associating with outer membrane [Chitinophaga niabensis]